MKRFTCITAALLLLAGCSSKDRVIEIQSEEDLSGLTIAFASGSYYHDMYGSRGDIGIFAVNAEADCVQALQQGKADVFVTDEIALPKPELERLHLKRAFLGKENFNVAFALARAGTASPEAGLPGQGKLQCGLCPCPSWNGFT